jgi:TolB-like protein/class 3 adenylate cyclase/Tfp pilus assembly protein PilF
MSADNEAELELQIAHVLFIDIVGYSRLLIDKQREFLDQLNRIVRSTNRFRAAEAADKLIRLPAGDGMALVFLDNPEAPAECALQISQALKGAPHLPLRMGIHSGPVSRVVDVNDRSNVAGAGINIAQRVMSCGDAGHILLSKRTADDLVEYRHWQPHLHEIGECEVKHGTKITLVNLYSDELGNPELPNRCKEYKRESLSDGPRGTRFAGRRKIALITAALVVIVAIIVVLSAIFLAPPARWSKTGNDRTLPSIPEKSIAVLPFENLSDDKQNTYFADGVQDAILTDLTKIADLKVISRTSVMQYKSGALRNLRDIAKALGVAHILEGTVQPDRGRVRVRAQLIDARTDTHIWAESYDRDLADVFAIENELAGKIVTQLRVKLSPSEKAAIAEQPTKDLAAYDLYTRAKIHLTTAAMISRKKENYFEAARLLDQAVKRDPHFLLAYYELARTHDEVYLVGIDHTPTRVKLAEEAVQQVTKLRPESGEAHLARAFHLYSVYLNYDEARKELAVAQTLLPNEPWAFELAAYIDRRRGRWEQSLEEFKRAIELDPRNVDTLQQIALSYGDMRQFDEMAAILDRALALTPKDIATRVRRSLVDLEWRADLKPLQATIEASLAQDPKAAPDFAENWLYLALCGRNPAQADRAIAYLPAEGYRDDALTFPRAWCEGLAVRLRGDEVAANQAFTAARLEAEKAVADQPGYAAPLCVLGVIDAMLGRKEDAIKEGRRAVELLPVSKDAINGTLMIQYLAVIYAWVDDKDQAIKQLELAARLPGAVSYGQLRLYPLWDPLRGDPRFEKIVASLAPRAQ